jgi:hypothetical protein
MQWRRDLEGWFFEDCPVVGRQGRLSGQVSASADAVSFSLTLRNLSGQTWKRALAWVCFNHALTGPRCGQENYLYDGAALVRTPPRRTEHYCLRGHDRDWWERGSIQPAEAFMATRCEHGDKAYAVGIGGRSVLALGQNPAWPCTDMALLFGDLAPGQAARVEGRIWFRAGGPSEIRQAWRQDFGGEDSWPSR